MGQIGSDKKATQNENNETDDGQMYGEEIDEYDDMNNSAYSDSAVRVETKPTRGPYKPKTEIGQDVAPKPERYVEYEGYRFPVRLDNPWAVAKVLNQSKGRLTMKELRTSAKTNSFKISAQAKVSVFDDFHFFSRFKL